MQTFGTAEHAIFDDRDTLTTRSRVTLVPGSVLAVDRDLVHQMSNPSESCFLSIHLHGCDGLSGGITNDARILNLESGTIDRVDGGVFFDLAPSELQAREPGLAADLVTTLLHHVELLRRILRKHSRTSVASFVELQEAWPAVTEGDAP